MKKKNLKLAKIPMKSVLKDGLSGVEGRLTDEDRKAFKGKGKTMRISKPIQPVEGMRGGKKIKPAKDDMSPMYKKLKMKKRK